MEIQSEFLFTGDDFRVTDEMKRSFDEYGYIFVRSLLSKAELNKLQESLESDGGIVDNAFEMADGKGKNSRLSIWSHPGEDVTGMLARCEKVVTTSEELLDKGEVYHYHTKLVMKEAHTGGAFVWHQDYGYWYNNGCLFPDLLTVFIAVDKADVGNGCLRVLRGSHKLGRIDHKRVGQQTGADIERVEQIKKVLPLVNVELNPGDALFFHCNVLHLSEQNHSDRRRWAFLLSYNTKANNPVKKHHHPQYTPLVKVPNSAILDCQTNSLKGKDFMDPKTDETTGATKRLGDKTDYHFNRPILIWCLSNAFCEFVRVNLSCCLPCCGILSLHPYYRYIIIKNFKHFTNERFIITIFNNNSYQMPNMQL